ncbi:MAG: hypothetical protein ACMUIE_06545 [Thermoplasmatota archaeon]
MTFKPPWELRDGKAGGILFMSNPTQEVLKKVFIGEKVQSLMWILVPIVFFILGFDLFIAAAGGSFIGLLAFNISFLFTGGFVIGLFLYFVLPQVRKWEKKEPESYVKIFRDVLAVYQHRSFWDTINIIHFGDIGEVRIDGVRYFKRKGYRFPIGYRPLVQMSPVFTKHKGALYNYHVPLDHIVVLVMKKKVPIMNHASMAFKSMFKMATYNDQFEVEEVFISIRPEEKKRFLKLARSRMKAVSSGS